ncbi:MAG: GNAT family N-acetyltransferase [Solobacterium sp.]|nr:GNAT family N-acetyltransferase [Solobacterium sp.]
MEVIRAIETWQQAGAYYVRIQAMAKKHHITLRQEFDDHDGPDTKYIVITDADFPIATARMYRLDAERMMIGRVVVLPEYRHQGIGTLTVRECEKWASELGCTTAVLESRDNKTAFYEQMDMPSAGKKAKVIPSARCGWKRQSEDQRMAASVFHLRRNVVK